MEIVGSIVVFLLGLVLTVLSLNDIWNRFVWGYASENDTLIITIPVTVLGIYLMYIPFS